MIRIAKQPLPRERRIYGHLIVMAIINITIPFLLITWAEQYVESSLAAILTSPVPLFAIVLSAWFLPDEPIRVNGLIGLVVGFVGVRSSRGRGLSGEGASLPGELALLGATVSYGVRRRLRATQRPRPAGDGPRGLRGLVRGAHHGVLALLTEHPWTATPDGEAVFAILWLGVLGSGLAYLLVFRLFANWGATRTTMVAYVIPVVGITLGYLVLQEPVDARIVFGTALVITGIGLVNSRFGRRRLYGRVPPIEAV